jgi:dTDP-4-amino-4,6-dideoxygalactose transaminase
MEDVATPDTRVAIPVHIGGAPADLDAILPIARRRGWRVIEDACQAHLGEWRGKKLGSVADCGCFSFQSSKNLNSGEGGAFITSDEDLYLKAWAFHGNGRGRKVDLSGFAYVSNGANLRLTEFQAALLMAQMTRLERQSKTRDENAAYLSSLLRQIPGITPAKLHDGCTRCAWHLYMFRYDSAAFAGAPRAAFLKALAAEGIPASGGYTPLNKEPFLERVLSSRHYRRVYGDARLKQWRERNGCPVNEQVCREAVWLIQTQLLGSRNEMDRIADAIRKVQKNAGSLKSA